MKNRFIIILICLNSLVYAQTSNDVIEYWMNSIENENLADGDLYSNLEYYIKNKTDLNHSDIEVLSAIPFLNDQQAIEIIEHRRQYGHFLSLYELMQIQSIDRDNLEYFFAFFKISQLDYSEKESHSIQHAVSIISPQTRGIKTRNYGGNQVASRLKYSYSNAILDVGFRLEKDAGEAVFNTPFFPFVDYSSAYLQFKNFGVFRKIIMGHFECSFGQGLCLSTSNFIGTNFGIEGIKRTARGINPYNSFSENTMLQGIGIQIDEPQFTLVAFYSNKLSDASLDANRQLSGLNSMPGLHRSGSELRQRKSLTEQQWGLSVTKASKHTILGMATTIRNWNAEIKSTKLLYKLHEQYNTYYAKGSVFGEYYYKNTIFYGETCLDHNTKTGSVFGLSSSFGRLLDISFLIKQYEAGFVHYQSSAFSRHSNFSGEEGLYLGFRLKFNKVTINTHNHQTNNRWLRYQLNGLSQESNSGIELLYSKSKKLKIKLRYRNSSVVLEQQDHNQWFLESRQLHQVRFQLNSKYNRLAEFRWRMEVNIAQQTYSSLAYIEYIQRIPNLKIDLSCRLSVANVPNSSLTLFSFERVIPSAYPLYSYSASCTRNYVFIKYKSTPRCTLWLWIGTTNYRHQQRYFYEQLTIGSGNDLINGSRKNTFVFQYRYSIN